MGRILAKHKDYEEKWAIQAVHLASRLGKQPEDVALSRAFKFRKRREKLDHLHKSKPVYERLPGHLYWQVSLRNCHSRFVHSSLCLKPCRSPCHLMQLQGKGEQVLMNVVLRRVAFAAGNENTFKRCLMSVQYDAVQTIAVQVCTIGCIFCVHLWPQLY